MAAIAYLLNPRAPFHLGERGIGIEESANRVHSDTLFSALVSAWRVLGTKLEPAEWATLRITSAFPFVEQGVQRVLFFPKPAGGWLDVRTFAEYQRGDKARGKAGKKVMLLSRALFQRVAEGQSIIAVLPPAKGDRAADAWHTTLRSDVVAAQTAQNGRALMTWQEYTQIAGVFAEQREPGTRRLWIGSDEAGGVVPRVTVDRISSASSVFFCGAVRFAPGCGLYFAADVPGEMEQKQIEVGLDYLACEGLGGRRSQGYGQFEYALLEDWTPPRATNPDDSVITLSLYLPLASERDVFALPQTRYDLIQRRGWVFSPDGASYRRKSVTMLAEGARLARAVTGDIAEVKPEGTPLPHPVYRYGVAYTVPSRLSALPGKEGA
jgi:CRISPR-associated protein Csm4